MEKGRERAHFWRLYTDLNNLTFAHDDKKPSVSRTFIESVFQHFWKMQREPSAFYDARYLKLSRSALLFKHHLLLRQARRRRWRSTRVVWGVRARLRVSFWTMYVTTTRLSRCRVCGRILNSNRTSVSPPPWVQGRAVQLQAMGSPRPRRPLQL